MKRLLLFLLFPIALMAQSPGGSVGDTQCNSGSGTFSACANSSAIRYVSSTGKDSNSGLTWDTAKATIYSALESLPGGSTNPPTAGAGTVYFGDNVAFSPFGQNYGLWLMGVNDPNYANPPTGWLRISHSPLNIIGQGCTNWSANNTEPQCSVNFADYTTNNPVIVPNSDAPFRLENMKLNGHTGRSLVLGMNSTGTRIAGPVLQTYRNLTLGSDQANSKGVRGPGIDIGYNVFGIWFDKVTLQGNIAANQALIAPAPNGLVRSGGTLTVTFTAPNTVFVNGESCGILGASNPGFNSTAHGNGVGPGITVVDSTHITMPQGGLDATGGGGVFMCDPGIPVVIDGGTHGGSGFIFFKDAVFNGGGIKEYGSGSSGVGMDNIYTEGDFTHCTPPVLWFIASGGGFGQSVTVRNIGVADQCPSVNNAAMPMVKVEGGINPDQIQIWGAQENPYTEGSLTYHGDTNYYVNSTPLARGEWGVVRGHLEAQTDVHRHSPQSVRYYNWAPPSNYWLTGGTLTGGVTDNDGGTAAFSVTTTKQTSLDFMEGNPSPGAWNVGDIGICGVWMKSLGTPDPYQGNGALNIACNTAGGPTSGGCNLPVAHGDGEWDWYFCFFVATGSASYTNFTTGTIYPANPIAVYAPIMIRIPAGQISSNEMVQLAYDMRSTPNGCAVGQMCDHIGPVSHSIASGTLSVTAGNSVGCVDRTVTATGATTAMKVMVSPVSAQANTSWSGYVSAANTVDIRVCTIVTLKGSEVTYNWSVIP